jgi:two-component system CheB/CheR fusion protein
VLASGAKYFDIQVLPVFDHDGTGLGVVVIFTDVTSFHAIRSELLQSRQELETAYEELQSTNEELETTNEELQSTVEELETTNEELQSANEELETINEEMQSTNSELETVNEEMRGRTQDAQRANALSESILGTLTTGVAVLSVDLRIQRWSKRCEDMWGLRADEVIGSPFETLDIGLPLEKVMPAIGECLSTQERTSVTVDATNRRGKEVTVRVVCTALTIPNQGTSGVVVTMDDGS